MLLIFPFALILSATSHNKPQTQETDYCITGKRGFLILFQKSKVCKIYILCVVYVSLFFFSFCSGCYFVKFDVNCSFLNSTVDQGLLTFHEIRYAHYVNNLALAANWLSLNFFPVTYFFILVLFLFCLLISFVCLFFCLFLFLLFNGKI